MKEYSIVIIGSGFGGQCAAINLLKRGISDFRILERRSFMGGTWCQNTYPGAAVDVQSPLYSLSFEPYRWTRMFARQEELKAYTNHIVDKYKLREKTEVNTQVSSAEWQDEKKSWLIKTKSGSDFVAKILINASGPLSTPLIPEIKGADLFRGFSFHTNSWDHSQEYKGRKIAVIGIGASAAQVIPAIAPDVSELHVFMRTPHWVMPRPDFAFPRFLQKMLGFKPFYNFVRTVIYWSLETRVIGFKYSELMLRVVGTRNAKKLLKKQIEDPELREKLTPGYKLGCKRVILSNDLFPALARENVTLHAGDSGIAEITASGIRTTGAEDIELDGIVYATGFEATDGVISYPVLGKNGLSLGEYWAEYPRAYLGTSMPHFPNLFIVTGPNTGIGHTSALFLIESQMNYIMDSVTRVFEGNYKTVEVKQEAEEKYTTDIHAEMKKTVWDQGGCNSWYKSKSGKVIAIFPGFSFTYRALSKRMKPEHHTLTK